MAFNVPEEEKPAFNKKVQSGLDLFAKDVKRTLGQLEVLQPQTLVEAYDQPVQAPVLPDLTPLERYAYAEQPQREVADIAIPPAREIMVVPQEDPNLLPEFANQAQAQFSRDAVSITPYEQEVTDIVGAEVDSLRNDAGEIAKSPLEVFSKPLNANSVRALGLVDQDGNPTERGQLFYNLQQSGVFNEDGTINEKGQAYLTPIADIGKEENLKAFQILWDDEVIRPNATFGEIASNTGKFVVDAALGGATRIGQEAQSFWYNSQTWDSALGRTDLRPKELRDKMTASGLGLVEGAVENLAGWAGIADVGSSWIGKKLYDILPAGMEEEAEQALYAARQRQWQTQQDIANLSTGEIAEAVLRMDNAVAEAESAKSRIGKEEFNKQYRQTSAFSQLALDPTNAIPASIAVKAARTAPLANRVAITAQKRMASIAAQDLAIAEAQTAIEAANAVLKKEAATVSVANRLASDISTRAGASPELVARANQASQVASRISDSANQIRSTLPTVTAELEGLVAKRNSLATRIPEAYSQKVLQTMELGRQMRSMPAKAVGATLERVGDTISKTDTAVTNFLQERGLDQMYTAAVGAAGVVGLAGNPIIGALGAGAAALKTGKVLSNYGKLFRYVGKEMENVRGQIPFWKRVAAHTAPGSLSRGFAHTFNMLDLGGVTSDTIRRAGRGIAAAAPTDLMFEYLSDGADMRPETLYQAGTESFFIGGSFAGAGGAFMGTKKRMRELSIGDEINFRRDLTDPRQKALFEAIPAGTRRAISTYAIANPTLNYTFKDSGASRYDPNTNTAVINVNSTNPIKALVAHETLHHTVIKNNMEPGISALFLGDTKNNTVGGLFRSRDGKLDPNFEAFRDGYYKRLGVEGMSNAERDAIYPLDKIAVEYFIEKHADQYAAMAESGELGAVAASGAARRKLGSILETVLPRIPVLKDLHFKSGGMIDKNGAWVTGNGILDAEGVKRDPITSKMFRDMNRRSAGLVPGQFDPLMSDKPDSGAPILLNPADGIDAELLHPLVQVDDANKPIMKDGKPVALDRATELSRALAGLTAKEVLQRKRSENYAPEKGEAYVDDEGQFQPGWLSNDVLTEMFAKNNYNPEQKRIIREMNKLIRKGAGDRVVMINFPATTRNKAGKVVYKPQGATLRDTVPVAVTISKDGNLLFGLMSVTKLHENIQKRSQDRRGKKLYGGNVDLILRDTQAMMDYHKQGVDSIEFFKQKYGAVEADERKKFINTMFGLLNQKEQAVLNPILLEDGVKSRDNVYRTYRADRVSKAVPMSPDEYPAMPFSYEAVSAVRMPEQRQMPEQAPAPSQRFMPEKLDADYMKAVESGDVETQQRLVDEAARKAGYAIKAYHGASQKLIGNKFDRSFIGEGSGVFRDGFSFTTNKSKAESYSSGFSDGESVVSWWAREVNKILRSIPEDSKAKAWGMPVRESQWDTGAMDIDEYSIEGIPRSILDVADQIRDAEPEAASRLDDLSQKTPIKSEGGELYSVFLKLNNPRTIYTSEEGMATDAWGVRAKSDSDVILDLGQGEQIYYVYNPNNAKSADPITRDDSGNIIPLSKRFDITSKDLRFMPEKLDADYMKAVESGDVGEQQRFVNKTAEEKFGSPLKDASVVQVKAALGTKSAQKQIDYYQNKLLELTQELEDKAVQEAELNAKEWAKNGIDPETRSPEEFLKALRMGLMPVKSETDIRNSFAIERKSAQKEIDKYTSIASQYKGKPTETQFKTGVGFTAKAYHATPFGRLTMFDAEKLGTLTGAPSATKAHFFAGDPSVSETYFGDDALYLKHKGFLKLNGEQKNELVSYLRGEFGELDKIPDYQVEEAALSLFDDIDNYDTSPIENVMHEVFVNLKNPLVYDFKGEGYREKSFSDLIDQATEEGRDGVVFANTYDPGPSAEMGTYSPPTNVIAVLAGNESQIKSADPITRDDSGNIIPLSKRFDITSKDLRFLPEPVENLSAFKGKRVQVLTSDLSLVGDVKYGDYTASFKGGPGYLDNDGWAFTDKAAADAFVTRWKKDGEPLIGLASLGSANHLNSLDARKAYAEKWKYLVLSGEIGEELANDHIKQAMKRIISSDSKNVKTDWRNAAKMIESADDLSNYFDKIPWAAAPMFYSKLTAKTLPIKYKKLVELGLDLESAAKEYRQPEFEGAELGDLYALAEYDGSTPEYKPELNKAYPWRIKFKKKATLSEMHNVAKLTTDPRAFAKKKVGGRLGAQPLMVTGINLDKLMSGDIAGSAKPLILRETTTKTKSNRAKQFGSGNPEAYRSYQQIQAERNAKKPKKKSTAKGNSSAIANAAKLK